MELLVLEHHPAAGPCRLTEVLDARATLAPWRSVAVVDGDPLPDDVEGLAGVVTLGGPGSVPAEGEPAAWVGAELRLLRQLVAADVPRFGIGLGAQLLALAGGGTVAARSTPRTGFLPLHRTEEGGSDELTAGWPDGAAGLLWHGDEVASLPPQAVPLLTAPDGVVAWRHGSAFATQAHPEVDRPQLEAWTATGELGQQVAAAGVDVEALLAEAGRRERFLVAVGLSLFGRFLDGPVRRRVTGSAR